MNRARMPRHGSSAIDSREEPRCGMERSEHRRRSFGQRRASGWQIHLLISVGKFNRYGDPRAEVLRWLGDSGACTFRTDYEGAVSFICTKVGLLPHAGGANG